MATIKFLLQSKTNNAPIYLRLSIARNKTFYRKTGLYINFKDWSESTGLPKQNNPYNKNLSTDLNDLSSGILKSYNLDNSRGIEINGEWLINKIDLHFKRISETTQSELVIDIIQNIVNSAHLKENSKGGIGLSKSRIDAYNRLKELFNDFQALKKYKVKDLDKKTFEKFKIWLLDDQKYSHTYAFKKLSDLKTVCKDARSNGFETSSDLDNIKTTQVSAYDDDMNVIILTLDDIEKIEKAKLIKEPHINARKWLILACFTGQRGKDLTSRILEKNFHKHGTNFIIKFKQQKGNKPVIIPVLPKVEQIYQEGLPYPISTQKLNIYFKEIGIIAELNEMILGRLQDKKTKRGVKKLRPKHEYISTHIGRRSFASLHYGKIPTPLLMKVTQHSKESTFLTYINQTDDSHVESFFGFYKTE